MGEQYSNIRYLFNFTNFKIQISVRVKVLKDDKLKNNFMIVESFDYNNNSDKFELKSYEKEIKNNLANIVTEKLVFKLNFFNLKPKFSRLFTCNHKPKLPYIFKVNCRLLFK